MGALAEMSDEAVDAALWALGPLNPEKITRTEAARVACGVIGSAWADLESAEFRLNFKTWDQVNPPKNSKTRAVAAVVDLRRAIEFITSDRLEWWASATDLEPSEIAAVRSNFLARARPVLGDLVSVLRRRGLMSRRQSRRLDQ